MSWVRIPPEAALLRKRELSSGIVALLCLVSMTNRSCMYIYVSTSAGGVVILGKVSKRYRHTLPHAPLINACVWVTVYTLLRPESEYYITISTKQEVICFA